MTTRGLRITHMLATMSAVAEIGIHLFLLPDHLKEKPYIGWLFVASAVILTAVVVALCAISWVESAGYLVGALTCLGMFGGFIVSRTVGLPMGYREGWLMDYALGIVSLVFEAIFVVCAAIALQARVRRTYVERARFVEQLYVKPQVDNA